MTRSQTFIVIILVLAMGAGLGLIWNMVGAIESGPGDEMDVEKRRNSAREER